MALDWNIGEVSYVNSKNYNQRRPEPRGSTLDPISLTIPGESMTIKQIMDRAINGISPEFRKVEFFDQEDMDNINNFPTDLTDLDNTRAELEALVIATEEAIAERDAPPEPDPPVSTPPTPDPTP